MSNVIGDSNKVADIIAIGENQQRLILIALPVKAPDGFWQPLPAVFSQADACYGWQHFIKHLSVRLDGLIDAF